MATQSGSFADLRCFSQRVSTKRFLCSTSVLLMKLLLVICDETLVIMLSLVKCGVSISVHVLFHF